jgi:CheY-like chemotaxis protein
MKAKAAARKTRAIIVDDSLTMRTVLRRALETLAFDVDEFVDAESCVASFPYEALPAVVFVDLHMPGMSGIDLIGLLRADRRCEEVFVVMVTTEECPLVRRQALERGADAFLAKPVEANALRMGLERLGFAWLEPA